MKIIIIISILLIFLISVTAPTKSTKYSLDKLNDHWSEFVKVHNKKYRNSSHEADR
jgi:hypothetical protein